MFVDADEHDATATGEHAWFVYLFASSDCASFKVGFSCNPLQRLYAFNHRYFERFDLHQSVLLQLSDQNDARAVEAALKTEFAGFRAECPAWVSLEAGGHTEWFSAVYFGQAEERLRSYSPVFAVARMTNAFDAIRRELLQVSSQFELWAAQQTHHIRELAPYARGRSAAAEATRTLRDWCHAYRYFDISLFEDDPIARDFVLSCVKSVEQ